MLPFKKDHVYDLIVIGGGTGGLNCAQEAKRLGLSVAIFDYVTPSTQGSQWGLGGTCVNVGCIPKKLCHIAAQSYEKSHNLKDYGWNVSADQSHEWNTLVQNI